MLLQQSGLYDRALRAARYSSRQNPCNIFDSLSSQKHEDLTNALRLKDMVGAFYALGFGLLLAFMAFLGECRAKRKQQPKNESVLKSV